MSSELEMTKADYSAYCSKGWSGSPDSMPPWDELDDDSRQEWINAARNDLSSMETEAYAMNDMYNKGFRAGFAEGANGLIRGILSNNFLNAFTSLDDE